MPHVEDALKRLPELEKKLSRILYLELFSSSGKNQDAIIPNVPNDVIFAHTYVSLFMASILFESIAPKHAKDSFQKRVSARKGHALLALKDAFTSILEVDYEPVFDIAVALVDSLFDLQGNPTIMQDMRDLIQTAQYVVANRALLRSDFAGHIYHQITGDVATRKGYATFYTKSPISSFLASLAVFYDNPQSQRNWADLSALRNTFRIIGVF